MKTVINKYSKILKIRRGMNKEGSCNIVIESWRRVKRYRKIFKERIFSHTLKSTKTTKTTINENIKIKN